MSTDQNKTVYPKYAINISASSISVEAPTKTECESLYLFVKQSAPDVKPSKMLEDAIR
jgi:hypothetical protein